MTGVRDPLPGVVYPDPERLKRYVEAGELGETTLVEALWTSFAANADRIAFDTDDGTMTYAALDRDTDRLAAALVQLGLKPLDRALFQSANSAELLIAIIGCLKAGLVPVCTLPAHREQEIGFLGNHAEARVHIVQGDDAKFDLPAFALRMRAKIPSVEHVISIRGPARPGMLRMEELITGQDADAARAVVRAIPRDPYQVAIFQLSGGTSGIPKIIPRMQNDYLLNATLTIRTLGYRREDVMFNPMPFIHNACMICFWLPTLLAGATYAIAADMTPAAWARSFARAKPTYVGLIRALLPRLDAVVSTVPGALDSVRAFWSPDASRVVRETYGRPAYAMFGMTEGMNMYCREGYPEEALDWTVGRPMSRFDEVRLIEPGTSREVAVGELGELTCRGPYTLAGYYKSPARNREVFPEDGFYRSGDLLMQREIDGELYYAFAGRTKDVIDRGAEKINCEEIENAVSTHAAVAGCAVVGMPDPVLGERVCVYLVPSPGRQAPDVAALQRHMEAMGFAKFKWPERAEAIEELPLTRVGKLDKAVLRADIAERLNRERNML